jgi:hypothetical protein
MSSVKPLDVKPLDRSIETEVEGNIRELVRRDGAGFRQGASQPTNQTIAQGPAESEIGANNLSALLRRVAGNSAREIDDLIGELQNLRDRLEADGHRVQRDIMDYADLSQAVMQLTKIISESVKKLPGSPSISP